IWSSLSESLLRLPRSSPNAEEEEEAQTNTRQRSERDLRGSLSNDSLSDDQIKQIEADREKAEAAAALREEDYQLAYAIDILKGLNALVPSE
ncbi:MAG: peptidase S41, partial [Pseudomonadota bacterium]